MEIVPLEPREELRQAYERVLIVSSTNCGLSTYKLLTLKVKETKPARLASLIRPNDVDGLFLQIGAKPQALDLSKPIEADTPDR